MSTLLMSIFLINHLPMIHNVVRIIFNGAKICIGKAQMTTDILTYTLNQLSSTIVRLSACFGQSTCKWIAFI